MGLLIINGNDKMTQVNIQNPVFNYITLTMKTITNTSSSANTTTILPKGSNCWICFTIFGSIFIVLCTLGVVNVKCIKNEQHFFWGRDLCNRKKLYAYFKRCFEKSSKVLIFPYLSYTNLISFSLDFFPSFSLHYLLVVLILSANPHASFVVRFIMSACWC